MMANSSQQTTHENEEAPAVVRKKRRYLTQKTLGRGAFGTVYLAREQDSGQLFAVKETFQDSRYKNREAGILKLVSAHPAIISVYQMFYTQKKDGKYLNIVMEYLPASLHDVIHKHSLQKKRMAEADIAFYAFQLVRACSHLWRLNIAHRDVKPQNIVLDPHSRRIRLCDFGSAKQLNDGEWNKHYICSRFYRAPELLCQLNYYSAAVDCWSLGCVLAEMYLNRPIFNGNNTKDQLKLISRVLGPIPLSQYPDCTPKHGQRLKTYRLDAKSWQKVLGPGPAPADDCSAEGADFLSNLLCYIPEQRFNLSSLRCLNHPFVARFISQDHTLAQHHEQVQFLAGEKQLIAN